MLPRHSLYFIQHGACTDTDSPHETHTGFFAPVFHNLKGTTVLLSLEKAAIHDGIQLSLYRNALLLFFPLHKKAEKMGRQCIKIKRKSKHNGIIGLQLLKELRIFMDIYTLKNSDILHARKKTLCQHFTAAVR